MYARWIQESVPWSWQHTCCLVVLDMDLFHENEGSSFGVFQQVKYTVCKVWCLSSLSLRAHCKRTNLPKCGYFSQKQLPACTGHLEVKVSAWLYQWLALWQKEASFSPWAVVIFKVSSSSRILVSLYTTNIIHTCYEHVQQHRNVKSKTNKKTSLSSSYHC